MRLTYSGTAACVLLIAAAVNAHEDDDNGLPHVMDDETQPTAMSMASMPMPMATGMSDGMEMDPSPVSMKNGHHHHGMPILENPDLEPQQRAYWEMYNTTNFLNEDITDGHAKKSFLVAHMVLTFMAWVVMYPVSVTISGIESASSLYLVSQTAQSLVALAALLCLAIYAPSAPSLYPNNAYGKMSIALFFIVVVHWTTLAIKSLAAWALETTVSRPIDGSDYMMSSLSDSANRNGDRRASDDSGHGFHSEAGQSDETADSLRPDIDNYSDDEFDEQGTLTGSDRHMAASPIMFETSKLQDRYFAKLMQSRVVNFAVTKLESGSSIVYTLINKPLFLFSLMYLLTGIIVFYRMGMGHHVFEILAHFIKGGVFFSYGLLTLGRYCGAFASHGMAWNIRPGSDLDHESIESVAMRKRLHHDEEAYGFAPALRRALAGNHRSNVLARFLTGIADRIPSMEFVESALIFFYGSTNVFLEHLGSQDGTWDHKDLQHVSIAFLYLGGGLCGLIVESKTVTNLLTGAIKHRFATDQAFNSSVDSRSGVSFNPLPAFTVFWTGILMSQHQQELELSTAIHAQWGTLLSVGAVVRLGTYLVMYLAPPSSIKPSRPFTELIVSFCLIAGGMVFIQSNGQTVQAMMYYGLDSMFSLNVNVGFAVLIMSWEMVVMTIRGWAAQR